MNQLKLNLFHSEAPARQPLAVCLGRGVDSYAMLIGMIRRGIQIDLITFADVGSEKPQTYEQAPTFDKWLVDNGAPQPLTCDYQGMKPKTEARYLSAVDKAARELQIALGDIQRNRLGRLFGNMIANETMPSQAFGMKSCSIKWKVEAQEFQ